jgi:flavodoxin
MTAELRIRTSVPRNGFLKNPYSVNQEKGNHCKRSLKMEKHKPQNSGRRAFLKRALAGAAGLAIGAWMPGCSNGSPRVVENEPKPIPAQPTATASGVIVKPGNTLVQPTPITIKGREEPVQIPTLPASYGSKVLLVYFSRAGENYSYGGRTHLDVGNTAVIAGMISQRIACDVYRIEAADPYADNYAETVLRNAREQAADARPAIANPLDSIESYNIVLLGSPIWNNRAPLIMTTFAEGFDFTGKSVFPFTTHAMSGLGTTLRDYTAACPGATIGEGLAVRGEEVKAAGDTVAAWLQRTGLLKT